LLTDDVEVETLEDEEQTNPVEIPAATTSKLVDSVPPPPLPSTSATDMISGARTDAAIVDTEHASLEEGWEDDDGVDNLDDDDRADIDVDGDIDDDDHNDISNSSRIIFDHMPHPSEDIRRHTTIDATCDDDDISRDDTLSMTNSRSYQQQQHQQHHQQNTSRHSTASGDQDSGRMVNWTPETSHYVPLKSADTSPIVSALSDTNGSLAVLRQEETDGNSTLDSFSVRSGMGDSITTASTTNTGGAGSIGVNVPAATFTTTVQALSGVSSRVMTKPRRMVDFTPRYSRGASGDASLAVAGHTSVGESLDSIAEEDDDSENDSVLKEFLTSNPNNPTISTSVGGGAISGLPPLDPYDEMEENSNNDDSGQMVNAIPNVPKALRRSVTGASVEVLSDSSESGDLGDYSDVGSIKDDLYGPMVSHTPSIPAIEAPVVSETNTPPVLGTARQGIEDDTVVGHADKDVEKDIQNDDEMDDESSRGESSTFGLASVTIGTITDDNRSLLSGRLPVVDETEHVVDFVPREPPHRTADASTMVLMDDSSESSRVTDNVNEDVPVGDGFGPVVSHIPAVSRRAPSITISVVTQVSGLAGDIKEDDEMDNTTIGFGERPTGSTGEGDELLDEQDAEVPITNVEDHIVDMVPPRRRTRATADASVRVLVDRDEDSTQVGTINEEAVVDFVRL
jgi:hypothetical protein